MSEDIDQIFRAIRTMREDVNDFRDEFAELSDEALNAEIERQDEISDGAQYKADAGRTELSLRKLRRALIGSHSEASS
ncbi:MAG: hypothetical protein VX874_15725 [Pseudomonadota bacterium]|nr:hypothetical protein [Pseudomonadota bacterium]